MSRAVELRQAGRGGEAGADASEETGRRHALENGPGPGIYQTENRFLKPKVNIFFSWPDQNKPTLNSFLGKLNIGLLTILNKGIQRKLG